MSVSIIALFQKMPSEFFLRGGGQTHLVHLRALPDVDPQVVPDEREQSRGEVDLGFFRAIRREQS